MQSAWHRVGLPQTTAVPFVITCCPCMIRRHQQPSLTCLFEGTETTAFRTSTLFPNGCRRKLTRHKVWSCLPCLSNLTTFHAQSRPILLCSRELPERRKLFFSGLWSYARSRLLPLMNKNRSLCSPKLYPALMVNLPSQPSQPLSPLHVHTTVHIHAAVFSGRIQAPLHQNASQLAATGVPQNEHS